MRHFALILLSFICFSVRATEMTNSKQLVNFISGDLLLNNSNHISIFIDSHDMKGVDISATNLCTDIKKVCGAEVKITTDTSSQILIGTIGHSTAIDAFIKKGLIDSKALKGKREKFIMTIIDKQLVVAGSDRRGTIYGIYSLSRQIGVSPWYWWADVPVEHHEHIYVNKGVYTEGEPAVRYRGIFLNDEAPCLTTWVKNTYGTNYGGHQFYARVFELLLRLKANFIWPAMWNWAFYADDTLNSKTANDMGIIVGTSHHEPMCRSQKEWHNHSNNFNHEALDSKPNMQVGGQWDYSTNKENLDAFWAGGVTRNKDTEDLITIGMRGDGDMPMSENQNINLLENVISNQRRIIEKQRGKKASEVPQVWALYKEVMDYYNAGLKVPDDVTLLLCDDNWGNIRRVPTAKERKRKGGWGIYYHVDYVGAPRNSKWINVTPTQNMWEQLTLAYDYGIDRLWILNVGDLKPMEYPIQMFMDMAWRPKQYTASNITDHTRTFCAEQWGENEADEAARLLNLCCKLNGRCTPEMLNSKTYNLSTGEWAKVISQYVHLEKDALCQFITLRPEQQDSYRELILFPIQAMGNLHYMYYAQAMNDSLYRANNLEADHWADECTLAFKRDSILCRNYDKNIAGGKWDGMMIQNHIGYTSWNDNFTHEMMPSVHYLSNTQTKDAQMNESKYIFSDSKGFVAMEAQHYYAKTDYSSKSENRKHARWTVIPYMGRTLSGMTLIPYTDDIKGESISYRFKIGDLKFNGNQVKVHIITKSTLDFLNKGGLEYNVYIDDGKPTKINFNHDLNEKPENIYSKYYPTIARRVIESIVPLTLGNRKDGIHTLCITPLDPGIVIEKIVIDLGGYQPSYLFGEESEYHQER